MWLVVGQCCSKANRMTKQDFIFFIVLMFDTRIHLKFLIIVYDGQYIGVVETKATQLGKEHSLMSKQGVAFTAICFDQDWRIQKTYYWISKVRHPLKCYLKLVNSRFCCFKTGGETFEGQYYCLLHVLFKALALSCNF